MQILITLHYFVADGKFRQSGDFKVDVRSYKEDPDKEAARVAYEWFREIRREFIYNVELYKALYNEIDITEIVKKGT
ncbi:hypothetical protein [Bacillus sp. V2I10]|uniref:hypothetical protein n=1 Tax=Bacillus sp. V2I10 TaxID=3042276 RepID=UPI002783EFD5|nr:hypothetical protein [Bacillus sp. V2I10]MDQ0860022.1 hypothetical protein [Bacillus sp. V2I10]